MDIHRRRTDFKQALECDLARQVLWRGNGRQLMFLSNSLIQTRQAIPDEETFASLRDATAKQAFSVLHEAMDAGFRIRVEALEGSGFNALRDHAGWEAFRQEVESRAAGSGSS